MSIFGKNKKANDKDNAKIKLVEVSQLHFDRDFKNVFQQIFHKKHVKKNYESNFLVFSNDFDKVTEIANDIVDWKCVNNNCENLQQLFSIYLH